VPGDDAWLRWGWEFTRAALPGPPATVIEVGCGTAGGFVPALLNEGYTAVGIDPEAPSGPAYLQAEFEGYHPPRPVDAIVACTSLHHVADLGLATERFAAALRPGGTVVVIEWASERFDVATSGWCFARLPTPAPGTEPGWLARGREEWLESGLPWGEFHAAWRAAEGLHDGEAVLRALGARFRRLSCAYGPYFFPDLEVDAAAEQAAIDAGEIQASGIRYTGTLN
jgi:SAM-dependent methyltransferase